MKKEYEWVIEPEYETVFFSNNYGISRDFGETNDNSVSFIFWNDEEDEIEFEVAMIPSVFSEYPEPIFDILRPSHGIRQTKHSITTQNTA